jgi:thioredoxin reductase
VVLGSRVMSMAKLADGTFELTTEDGAKHLSKTILITAGVGAFSPNKLDAPGVKDYEGKGVSYFVRDKESFKGKNVLIVGGGDSAVDWALNLHDWARKITIVHRRDVFRAHEGSLSELVKTDCDIKLFYEVKEVSGDGNWVKQAVVYENRTKAEMTLDVDEILINIGFRADLGPIRNWPIEINGREIRASAKMETSVPGIYVAGDIAGPVEGIKLNLIATGFAQAAVAVNVAKNFIDPNSRVFPGHSSEMKM